MNSANPALVMMVGLPASGKSTYAKELAKKINATIFSSDELRKEMFGDVNNQDNNSELFIELHKRIKDCLKSGSNAIYDATNISSKRRRSFLQELNKIDCVKKCIIVATQPFQCLNNNMRRDRQIPEDVIVRMFKHWNTPYWFEGWDDIEIVYPFGCEDDDPYEWMLCVADYNQDNPYHTLSLGEHCFQTAKYVMNYCDNNNVFMAACVHDCGKPIVKEFKNSKGEQTEYAHYYLHENVGAYRSLFFKYQDKFNAIDVSILVNLHMYPYNWARQDEETELKLRDKYRELWGDDLFNSVIMLHGADKAAH